MKSLLTLNPIPGEKPCAYDIIFRNGAIIGQFHMDEDGFYKYCLSGSPSYWAAESLKAVAAELDNLNADYINKEFEVEASLTDENGTYRVGSKEFDSTLGDLIDRIIRPLLLAAGYQPSTIEQYIPEK